MRVVHINCANYGSTGKIIKDIATYMEPQKNETFLCCAKTKPDDSCVKTFCTSYKHQVAIMKRIQTLFGLQYGFAPYSTRKIIRLIKKIKPDVVHIHSANRYMVNLYRLLRYIGRKNIPLAITNHAEFFYTGNCSSAIGCEKWKTGCGNCPKLKSATGSSLFDLTGFAWKKMKKSMEAVPYATMVSVSPYVYGRAILSPITNHLEQKVILNGLDTSIFRIKAKSDLRSRLEIPQNTKILLHVTAHFSVNEDDLKGGKYVVELANRLKDENVVILVIGYYKEGTQVPDNVRLIGPVYNQEELAEYYSISDLTIITSRRETYSMPVAESLSCGTPVVGFCAGGPESIAIKEYSDFVEYGNVDKLEKAARHFLFTQPLDKRLIENEARNRYSSDRMAQEYYEVYDEVIKKAKQSTN